MPQTRYLSGMVLKRGRAVRRGTKRGNVVGDTVELGISQGMIRVAELGIRCQVGSKVRARLGY
jgi:hypothetical protein